MKLSEFTLQGFIEKIRALIAGEGETERIIREKVDKTYREKRAPKVKSGRR